MNAYYTSKKADRTPIDTERHSRLLAARLTKHDLPTVQAAATDWADAHDEYLEAYASLWDVVNAIVPKDDQQYVGWELRAPAPVQFLMKAHHEAYDTAPAISISICGRARHSGDSYPVSRWAKDAARYRSAAKRLRKAVFIAKQPILEATLEAE